MYVCGSGSTKLLFTDLIRIHKAPVYGSNPDPDSQHWMKTIIYTQRPIRGETLVGAIRGGGGGAEGAGGGRVHLRGTARGNNFQSKNFLKIKFF